MRSNLPQRVTSKPLSIRAIEGEGDRTKGANPDATRVLGSMIARAFDIAGLDQKDVAFRLGYPDHTRVSKWVAGVENPQLARLFEVEGFRSAFLVALAEASTGKDIEVETTIRWKRRA